MERIYPSVEELSTIETSIRCTEGDCTAIFKCTSNLNLHLAKHHGNKDCAQMLMKTDTPKEYFCPSEGCIYHLGKSFKNMKYLKQHFLKVHSKKNYKCSKCTLSYPTETLRKLHEDFCGVNFKCPECPVKYNSYDTLTTHSRRKGHKIFPKLKYKALFNGDVNACSRIICVVDAKPMERLILPKEFLTVNKQHETGENLKAKVTATSAKRLGGFASSKGSKKKRKSTKTEMHTQTQTQKFLCKAVKSTSGTQTEVVSVHSSTSTASFPNPSLAIDAASKKSIKTQTTTVTSSSRACNTSFDIKHFASYERQHLDVERNTLGTQTLSPNILSQVITTSTSTSSASTSSCRPHVDQGIEIGTGTEDLLQTYAYINDSNFGNMEDMETQTDWLANLDLLTNDVHSHNYTQTCDDILPPDLRFNNTHTQTVLNDILRSVGSQTNMRLNGGVFTNNETQTDSIFEELLQVINS